MNRITQGICITVFCVVAALVSQAGDYSTRKFNNEINSENPLSGQVIDADCLFDSGKFVMKSLPKTLPSLFTVRFTAPADFTEDNTIVIGGKELPVLTPAMANAASGLYKAGAVVHCDIDMEREIAFFAQFAGRPIDLSESEHFAGYHDTDGAKVYRKVIFANIVSDGNVHNRAIPHNIPNIKNIVDYQSIYSIGTTTNSGNTPSYNDTFVRTGLTNTAVLVSVVGISWEARFRFTLEYTCTDR